MDRAAIGQKGGTGPSPTGSWWEKVPGTASAIWSGTTPGCPIFELTFDYRLPGPGNTGVEIRAHPDPTGRRPLIGYHADLGHVGIGPHILGAWDFHFDGRREPPCPRGTRLVIPLGRTDNLHPAAPRLNAGRYQSSRLEFGTDRRQGVRISLLHQR
ncbi:MAG: hypothetical protein KatS3mg027_0001 [Bacteroidia bacterium]|nr:MAG: hypothetical protein KatS3mg027_0001 [Bacteroidia bacterium]